MASAVQQDPVTPPAADVVGHAFVHQYYHILHQSPELVHRFYQDCSKLGRPEEGGILSITTTMQAINEKILSLEYGECTVEIITVDAQESYNNGVIVLVTGYLTRKDNVRLKFTQAFFLAPQDKGYFVLNDVFRYLDVPPIYQNGSHDLSTGVEAPVVSENHLGEPEAVPEEEIGGEEVYSPPEDEQGPIEEEEEPLPEVVDEVSDDVQMVAESNSKIEEVPKKSYASILKVTKENIAPFPTPAPPRRSVSKSEEQQMTDPPPPVPLTETVISNTHTNENGNIQEVEGDGHSIYLKGLPPNVTHMLLENEFSKFGPIRSGGIQVRNQKGFGFGFIEFEVTSAVQSAIEASPILINGRHVVVEEKRSTNRGNSRGRYSSGRVGGYRSNEGGGRGRGVNYGGGSRSFGRSNYINISTRADYGNRYTGNRGGEGEEGYHHRAEPM